jgi:arabinofuranosyltransferase
LSQENLAASTSGMSRAARWMALTATPLFLVGWWNFWFLCDDAYIAFRYVNNSALGHGYVWNPPPFSPVEGYTSFAWVAILDLVNRLGIPPERAANPVLLGFALLGLWGTAWAADRTPLCSEFAARRPVWVGFALAMVLSNRTSLAWASSGLETAMFVTTLLAWAATMALGRDDDPRRGPTSAALAAALALTRPDGLLFAGFTVVWLVFAGDRRARSFAPLAVVPAHLAWRWLTYGDWLPNTHRAKTAGWWVESGLRYSASFAIEYAYWIALLAVVAAGVRALQRRARPSLGLAIAASALSAHLAYYVLRVGGDHFEYRIFAHIPALVGVALPWTLSAIGVSSERALVVCYLQLILSLPIPWAHWALSQDLWTRAATFKMHLRVAPHLPPGLSAVAAVWDDLQGWLIARSTGTRHQEHLVMHLQLRALLPDHPSAVRGALVSGGTYLYQEPVGIVRADADDTTLFGEIPVHADGAVGVLGWGMPQVAIVDTVGLNDRFVAGLPAGPPPDSPHLQMAHLRFAPPEYSACYRPNISLHLVDVDPSGRLRFRDREVDVGAFDVRFPGSLLGGAPFRPAVMIHARGSLSADHIRACERGAAPDHAPD